MILISGTALGLRMASTLPREGGFDLTSIASWEYESLNVLWGLSIVGPPMLYRGRRHCRTWGQGEWLWFGQGVAAWLLALPMMILGVRGAGVSLENLWAVFAVVVGFPVVALVITLMFLLGGWPLRRRRRNRASWKSSFGLGLGLLTACEGIYVLLEMSRTAFTK